MKLDKKPVLPQGYQCLSINCGLKPNKEERDFAVFISEQPASAAGVFTLNQFPGAPVIVGRQILKKQKLSAIAINSKISNVGTGDEGINNVNRMAHAVAKEFTLPEDQVLISSTGVIAQQLPIELIEKGIPGISAHLQNDPIEAVRGIMTTDSYPKALSASIGGAT